MQLSTVASVDRVYAATFFGGEVVELGFEFETSVGIGLVVRHGNGSAVLVDVDGIAVGVGEDEAGGACGGGVGFGEEGDALGFEVLLDLADVLEGVGVLAALVPAGVEGEDVALEHALEEADKGITVFHDEVVVVDVASKDGEAEGLVELFGGLDVFDVEADGEGT